MGDIYLGKSLQVSPSVYCAYLWLLRNKVPAYKLKWHFRSFDTPLFYNLPVGIINYPIYIGDIATTLGPMSLKDWWHVIKDKIFGEKMEADNARTRT
jgi:hypothetical protein